MHRRTLSVVAVVAALVVAGTAGAALTPAAAQESDTDREDRTITVTGDGTASTAPDKAVVDVAVVVEGDDPAVIRDELATGAADLRAALLDAGVEDSQITTEEYNIRQGPSRHPRERTGDEPDYRGVHAFRVELDDVDSVGPVVDAAADTGAQVNTVRFTLTEATRDDLRDEALENAMDDADRQAETLAATSDLAVSGVASIDATDRRYRPVRYDAAVAEAGGDGGGTSIETGDVSVSATVEVTYNATG